MTAGPLHVAERCACLLDAAGNTVTPCWAHLQLARREASSPKPPKAA